MFLGKSPEQNQKSADLVEGIACLPLRRKVTLLTGAFHF
jgi:hypothetical protein